jgi:hypothetical protein
MTRLFLDKSVKPDNQSLEKALGNSYKFWEELQNILKEKYAGLKPEWKYYGAKSGWTLKMMLKKKNLFFFGPCDNYFRIAFVFGDKAEKAIEESGISSVLIKKFKSAKRYTEGRGLMIEVRKQNQLNDIFKLVKIKVNYLGLK